MKEMDNITFGMLPCKKSCAKLMQISFSTPQKNLSVYKFCDKVTKFLDFFELERLKLIKQYGDPTEKEEEFVIPKSRIDEYMSKLDELFNASIGDEELILGLVEDDFSDEKCQYPEDKTSWLTPGEIQLFLRF